MPKIIENLEKNLIDEARRQVAQGGYAGVTIRSVAAACGVGVGTVYNYFPSKDALLASFMLEDWKDCVKAIEETAARSTDPRPVAESICHQLLAFARLHQAVFRDEAALRSFSGSFGGYHTVLRSQLAAPLRRFCADDFTAEFAAEALLGWTMHGKSFDEIYGIVGKLF